MRKTSVELAIVEAFKQYGFELVSTGGNCEAFVRNDGAIEEIVTLEDDPMIPTKMSDKVAIGTQEVDGDPCEQPLTGFTVTDVLAALRNPSDEYHLLSLRLDNGFHKPAIIGTATVLGVKET